MTNQSTIAVRRSISLPALMSISIAAGLGVQVLGVYAMWIAFGVWNTVALYIVGGLTILLQRAVAERRLSCSAGD